VTNHGGGVIASPKVVFIFFGPSFNNAASPDFVYARTLQAYRDQLGSSLAFQRIAEYGMFFPVNLGTGTPDMFDTRTPPTNVTDASVQGEVNRYLIQPSHTYDPSTIYEVLTPATSYSSSGSSTSCGGPPRRCQPRPPKEVPAPQGAPQGGATQVANLEALGGARAVGFSGDGGREFALARWGDRFSSVAKALRRGSESGMA
jgi:hypothetical protein